MSESPAVPTGPDLSAGIPVADLADGAMVVGHIGDDAVLLVRRGTEYFAIGATCSHYGGPLGEGLVVGDTVRCPWHHACFSLRTGAAIHAPALDPVACYPVAVRDGRVTVGATVEPVAPSPVTEPKAVVIVGGGAAGNAAAETLRREGFQGRISVVSADEALPCDRPNLSKNYLAGTAPLEYTLLRTAEFYAEQRIEMRLGCRVTAIDVAAREIVTDSGDRLRYDALLLATGAEPVRLDVPGADLPHVHYLRSHADGLALAEAAGSARRAVVIGASFIGLEVAASLRARGVAVDVVAPDPVPMAKVLGDDVGEFLLARHRAHGVSFHLGTTVTAIGPDDVTVATGDLLPADLVVVGIGVRPLTSLAADAGLTVDNGVVVDPWLETSVPGIFAAGDIARCPDPMSGVPVRIEHWVVAERQGQTAARNILGRRQRYRAVPFFWTEQYDVALAYVGHAAQWDEAVLEGVLGSDVGDAAIRYRQNGETVAVATVCRDLVSLTAEARFEALIDSATRAESPE